LPDDGILFVGALGKMEIWNAFLLPGFPIVGLPSKECQETFTGFFRFLWKLYASMRKARHGDPMTLSLDVVVGVGGFCQWPCS
jgi:hypothetical protein